jgi:hypothetical protein
MNENLRQVTHDHMALIAAKHAAAVYRGIMDGDSDWTALRGYSARVTPHSSPLDAGATAAC